MDIRENIKSLKINIQNNKIISSIVLILNLIYPVILILNMNNIGIDSDLNFYSCLWVGFYSSIFSIVFVKKDIVSTSLIIINMFIVSFTLIISLMGGILGLLSTIIMMIFPFTPDRWISELIDFYYHRQ
ncbi:hypothetical protein [Gottschalkia acidurici]|uniref:hypothetical protein n=1 Tax=Clostridium acidurici TaxID=1556 RepID=UPI0005A0E079|nr:hypothetical protein [Gottschalkia acidurici]